MRQFESLLHRGIKVAAVVCGQWGDTGKGKIVDRLVTEWADVIIRGTGGANAGHTVRVGDLQFILHLIPSGILHDGNGKINIIGNGVAFEPRQACEELDELHEHGVEANNLAIAHNAKLILPQHILMDMIRESGQGSGKIGTTGRGIGPCYTDHYARIGLTVNDTLNPDVLVKKLERNLRDKLVILNRFDPEEVKRAMQHPRLEEGRYYSPVGVFNIAAVVDRYVEYGKRLACYIRDTEQYARELHSEGKRILLEGAQGTLLSCDFGTYPFVTSSDSSVHGLAKGAGLSMSHVDLTLMILKMFYMTRVGAGPFPTEFGGMQSEEWCARPLEEVNKRVELAKFGHASVNAVDPYVQGIGIRLAGDEYGASTQRTRRTGWLDLPLARWSRQINGPNVVGTKFDVLDECEMIKICDSYRYRGPHYRVGNSTLSDGDELRVAIPDPLVLRRCEPQYIELPGWRYPISEIRSFEDLPVQLRYCLEQVERLANINVRMLSVGADRDALIVRN